MLLLYDHMENGSLERLLVRKKPNTIIPTTAAATVDAELTVWNNSSSSSPRTWTEGHGT